MLKVSIVNKITVVKKATLILIFEAITRSEESVIATPAKLNVKYRPSEPIIAPGLKTNGTINDVSIRIGPEAMPTHSMFFFSNFDIKRIYIAQIRKVIKNIPIKVFIKIKYIP